MIHSVEIYLKSFTPQAISDILPQIRRCFPENCKFSFVHFPKTRKIFTVLRSPHIDKKARDQFQLLISKTKIKIDLKRAVQSTILPFYQTEILGCLESVKQISSPGVQIQIQILGDTTL
jgi:ribosomal protein S10